MVSLVFERVLVGRGVRGRAYTTLGLYHYLQQYPEAHDIEEKIDTLAEKNLGNFRAQSRPDWSWFEPIIAYDNAIMPHVLFLAHEVTGNEDYLEVARDAWSRHRGAGHRLQETLPDRVPEKGAHRRELSRHRSPALPRAVKNLNQMKY